MEQKDDAANLSMSQSKQLQQLIQSASTLTSASASTPRRSTRQSQSEDARQHIHLQPILPLLQALVHVEVVALGHSQDNNTNNSSSSKRTHFSGFDCSSTQPPVDRVDGSNTHQQDSIEALVAAKEQVQALMHLGRPKSTFTPMP
jgi:hypothetical protein